MEIVTTRDLRRFLAEVMVDVRGGKVKAQEAQAIAKLSSQINQSLAIEVNAALKQGLEKGAYVDARPLQIAGAAEPAVTEAALPVEARDFGDSEEVWCDQCDALVPVAEARGCKSRHCKAGL